MKNCILINSYPINDTKIDLLYTQITGLKSLNLPIILCSGCEVPDKISKLVDYTVINKTKTIKSASYQKRKFLEGKGYVSALYGNGMVMFNDFIDLTITQNIKLLFNLAKFYGFENAMYTEDDNIFVNFEEYIQRNLSLLNDSKSKMCAFVTEFATNKLGLHTTHFFANVDFIIKNYIFPHNLNELDKFEYLAPWQCYEMSIYQLFEPYLNDITILNIDDENKFIKTESCFGRDDDVKYILNQRFTLFRLKNNQIRAYIRNSSRYLNLHIYVTTKNTKYDNQNFSPECWYVTEPISFGDTIQIRITDKSSNVSLTRDIIYDDEDKVLALEL